MYSSKDLIASEEAEPLQVVMTSNQLRQRRVLPDSVASPPELTSSAAAAAAPPHVPPPRNDPRLFLGLMALLFLSLLSNLALVFHTASHEPHSDMLPTMPTKLNTAACQLGSNIFSSDLYSADASLSLYSTEANLDEYYNGGPLVVMSRNGKTIALANFDGTDVRLWASGQYEDIMLDDFMEGIQKIVLSGDGTMLLVAGWREAVLIQIADRTVIALPKAESKEPRSIRDMALNENGKRLVVTYHGQRQFWGRRSNVTDDLPGNSTAVPGNSTAISWNDTAVLEWTKQGNQHHWTVQPLSSKMTPDLTRISANGDTLVMVSSQPQSQSSSGELVVRTLRQPKDRTQPWQEHQQRVPHNCSHANIGMDMSSNGTILAITVQCQQLLDDDGMRFASIPTAPRPLAVYVLVWNDTTSLYETFIPWTSEFESHEFDFHSDFTITMSGDASLTVLTMRKMKPIVWRGDFWKQSLPQDPAQSAVAARVSLAISEDASTILLVRPKRRRRTGGICLLTRRANP